MSAHALLSPSGAERWLNCTPSARLEEQFPDTSGEAAKEGTLAHSLGELLIKQKLKLVSKVTFNRDLKTIQANRLYDNAMYEHAEAYAVFVMEQYAEALAHTKDAKLFLEEKIDLTDFVPEGFGTGDSFVIADHLMSFTDLKYGKGVPVSVLNNKQMMLYALGALRKFEMLYDIQRVRMTIFQPRLDNISTWELSVADLMQWAETELKPKAALAFEGQGEFAPGAHCKFCKAKALCKANADHNMELAKYDFKSETLLTDTEIADILSRVDDYISWIKAVEEHALIQAVNHGKKWPGFKLMEGRSNRQYADAAQVADTLTKAGFAEDLIYKKELLGITAMEKAIGKGSFAQHLAGLIIKPPGKPTLVDESDKRPEYHSAEAAAVDFAEN